MTSKIIFGQGASKAEMRAAIAAANIGHSNAPMASADALKANSNVPGMNFRGTHTKSSRAGYVAPRAPRQVIREDNRITIVTDHAGREFYRNAEGEWL